MGEHYFSVDIGWAKFSRVLIDEDMVYGILESVDGKVAPWLYRFDLKGNLLHGQEATCGLNGYHFTEIQIISPIWFLKACGSFQRRFVGWILG
ncbi:MAG: hypothetical protein R2813_02570 [Flavobacteriales bacterium]